MVSRDAAQVKINLRRYGEILRKELVAFDIVLNFCHALPPKMAVTQKKVNMQLCIGPISLQRLNKSVGTCTKYPCGARARRPNSAADDIIL